MELYCEKGIAKLVGEKATITFNDGGVEIQDRNPNQFFEFKNAKQYWGVGHMMEIENFYTSLSEGKKPKNSVDEVLDTHHLIDAIYKSGKENRKIVM